jgi:hypothetical protein
MGATARRSSSPGYVAAIDCRVPVGHRSRRVRAMKKLLLLIVLVALGTVAAKKIKAV